MIAYRQGYLDAVRVIASYSGERPSKEVLNAWWELAVKWADEAYCDRPPPRIADALALVRSRVPPDEPTLTQSTP